MRSWSAILAFAIVFSHSLAFAADGGWKMPSLNPFKSSGKKTKARVSDDSWVSMPKVPSMPGFKRASPRTGRKAPSTMTKMTEGTKSFFSKTYDVMTPWDNNKPKKPPTRMGVRRKPDDSEGGFFSWLGGEEERQPQTVNEWLGQGRPGFDDRSR